MLTPAEKAVALLMARGLGRQQVAASLGKSPKVVDQQRRRIYKKLRLKTGDPHVKLILMAIRRGWVQVADIKHFV